jgi:hypothetical protein
MRPMDKRVQFHLWYVVAALLGIFLLQQIWTPRANRFVTTRVALDIATS